MVERDREFRGSPCANEYVGRSYIDVSGTQIRSDPAAYWRFIDAPVRAHYVRRVSIVGAESTGSTTLVRSLASACETIWVPEYGRDYTVEKSTIGIGDQRLPSDFLRIALEQNALEDRMAREAPIRGHVLRHGQPGDGVVGGGLPRRDLRCDLARGRGARRPYSLYLLTDHVEIPWEADGVRVGDETRARMTARFEEVLTECGLTWREVTGSRSARLAQRKRLQLEPK